MKDDQGRRRGDRTTTLGADEVAACPECDVADVETGSIDDSRGNLTEPGRYLCKSCYARFDEFVVRRKRLDASPGGLAGRLLAAEPDEVSR